MPIICVFTNGTSFIPDRCPEPEFPFAVSIITVNPQKRNKLSFPEYTQNYLLNSPADKPAKACLPMETHPFYKIQNPPNQNDSEDFGWDKGGEKEYHQSKNKGGLLSAFLLLHKPFR